jgi:CubicO group peptidase (beta-lactamase class C family)
VSPAAAATLVDACRLIAGQVRSDPRYAHTSHLALQVDGAVLYDQHFRGPERADVFSVTKTVLATLVGIAQGDGVLPPLDSSVGDVLPGLRGTPAASHSWRQLLTMTRGSAVDGPWDVDEVTALPGGQVSHIASAPQRTEPGSAFCYDNGAAHLVSAALGALVGPVSDYAQERLFAPLGITRQEWRADPDGVTFGYGHLSVRAEDLLRLGSLWLDHGSWQGIPLVDAAFVAEMTSPQSAGGPPEQTAYGFLTWVDRHSFFAGGWAGQHVLVVPAARAVVVTTGDPRFSFGPPPSDDLPQDWRPALELVRRHLLPALLPSGADRPDAPADDHTTEKDGPGGT